MRQYTLQLQQLVEFISDYHLATTNHILKYFEQWLVHFVSVTLVSVVAAVCISYFIFSSCSSLYQSLQFVQLLQIVSVTQVCALANVGIGCLVFSIVAVCISYVSLISCCSLYQLINFKQLLQFVSVTLVCVVAAVYIPSFSLSSCCS